MKVVRFVFIVFTCFSIHAQDSIFYQQESKKFYDKEYLNWSEFYGKFASEKIAKFDISPSVEENDSLRNIFFQKLRDTLKANIYQKSQFKTELVDSLLEYRLMLWNYRDGGTIPDSTFLLLMDSYFDLDEKTAIDFCMQNWSIRKFHKMDRIEIHEIPWTKNFPYISYLFEKLSTSELLELFVLKIEPNKEKNKLLSKLCYRDLVYNKSKEIEIMKQYIELFLKVNSIKEYNHEFFNHFNK